MCFCAFAKHCFANWFLPFWMSAESRRGTMKIPLVSLSSLSHISGNYSECIYIPTGFIRVLNVFSAVAKHCSTTPPTLYHTPTWHWTTPLSSPHQSSPNGIRPIRFCKFGCWQEWFGSWWIESKCHNHLVVSRKSNPDCAILIVPRMHSILIIVLMASNDSDSDHSDSAIKWFRYWWIGSWYGMIIFWSIWLYYRINSILTIPIMAQSDFDL